MNSWNIDLTENHDFIKTSNVADPLRNIAYRIEYKMSQKEYELWVLRQRFFGKRLYENRKWYIFGDHRLYEMMESHCERCGKRIGPWEKATNYGLCEECNAIMEVGDFVPWKSIIKEREDEHSIFALR